jgi:hypothetical protein
MFRLFVLWVATMFGGLVGCATSVEPVALRTGETPPRSHAMVVSLTNRVLKVSDENTALREQIAELTEMLVESELSRTNHLVPAADAGSAVDRDRE